MVIKLDSEACNKYELGVVLSIGIMVVSTGVANGMY